MKLPTFEQLVVSYRKKGLNKVIVNSAWRHAQILLKNLLEAAVQSREDVFIVSGTLNAEFYDTDMAVFAKKCLKHNKITIIVIDPESVYLKSDFSNVIKQNENGELIINDNDENLNHPHFVLVGENKYRFEVDHSRTKAVANFNDPATGKVLKKMFDTLYHDLTTESEEVVKQKREAVAA